MLKITELMLEDQILCYVNYISIKKNNFQLLIGAILRKTNKSLNSWNLNPSPLEKAMAPPLQYSGLENPMDRGAWQATVHGVSKSWTRLSDFTYLNTQQN